MNIVEFCRTFIILGICVLFVLGIVQLFKNNAYTYSGSLSGLQKANLNLSNPPYYTNSNISVNYTVSGGTTVKDWIGLHDQNNVLIWWSYTDGKPTGTINNILLPQNIGKYMFRYYVNDTYTSIAASINFIVIDRPPRSLRQKVIDIASSVAPEKWGTPLWNEMMGGRIDGKTSWPGIFKYYSDNYGTTCGVVTNYIIEKAGAPPSMINRGPPCNNTKQVPCFGIGKHISKISEMSQKLGIMKKDLDGIKPGDLFVIAQDSIKVGDPSHIGTILYRDGNFLITADGGYSCNGKQCTTINFRNIHPKNRLIHSSGAGATLTYRVDWDYLK